MFTLNATDARRDWSAALNRKSHIPYVLKALIIDDAGKIGDSIECQAGKN